METEKITDGQRAEEAIQGAIEAAKTARRPGRPPKKRPEMALPDVRGIAERPRNESSLMEMLYCNPGIFKKLFALYKGYEVAEVEFAFGPRDIRLSAKDHYGKSTIYATIDGRMMNFYYCRDTYHICVKRDIVEKILGGIDKEQYRVGFCLNAETYRSLLYITVHDCQYDKRNSYEVEIGLKVATDTDPADDDTNYPIRFTLDSKHFKSEITKISKMSSCITIRKSGADHLYFTFDDAKKISYQGIYENADKIKLTSHIADDDILNASVMVDYIKPFSNAAIGDEVVIAADKTKKLSLSTCLDRKDGEWTCFVKVFVEIKAYIRV